MPEWDPQLTRRWIEALRSGKYAQGQYALQVNRRFCCLGVLAQIEDELEAPTTVDYRHTMKASGSKSTITVKLAKRAGLRGGLDADSEPNELSPLDLDASELANMNDSGNATFDEIADLLENRLAATQVLP